jgi:hypothetical protein
MTPAGLHDHGAPSAQSTWYSPSQGVVSSHPVRVARIARGELTRADRIRLNGRATRIDAQWRGGLFNGFEYFHFQRAQQAATMAGFLVSERMHRLVPGSTCPPTALEIEAEWRRVAEYQATVLAWARAKTALMEIVQTYRFERRLGAESYTAHTAAARIVEQIDRNVVDPMAHAGVCIEWAERQYREWFWRCAPDHQVL